MLKTKETRELSLFLLAWEQEQVPAQPLSQLGQIRQALPQIWAAFQRAHWPPSCLARPQQLPGREQGSCGGSD